MTLGELLARSRARQAIGEAEAFTELTSDVETEKREIKEASRVIEAARKKAAEQAKKQEQRRGIGRGFGGLLGYGLALAATGGAAAPLLLAGATGLGSFAGQKLAGDLSLEDVESGLGEGLFFKGARESITERESDLNRYLQEAEEGFKKRQISSALTDALTGYQVSKIDFKKLLGKEPSSLLAEATIPELEKANLGSLTRSRIIDPQTGLGSTVPRSIYDPVTGLTRGQRFSPERVSDILFGSTKRLGSPLL
tara:strand:+ start:3884 stop:4642 length:759 start_codon:yes stop_codon:yes gene_type:complete